jgi:hypothetical protein
VRVRVPPSAPNLGSIGRLLPAYYACSVYCASDLRLQLPLALVIVGQND